MRRLGVLSLAGIMKIIKRKKIKGETPSQLSRSRSYRQLTHREVKSQEVVQKT